MLPWALQRTRTERWNLSVRNNLQRRERPVEPRRPASERLPSPRRHRRTPSQRVRGAATGPARRRPSRTGYKLRAALAPACADPAVLWADLAGQFHTKPALANTTLPTVGSFRLEEDWPVGRGRKNHTGRLASCQGVGGAPSQTATPHGGEVGGGVAETPPNEQ